MMWEIWDGDLYIYRTFDKNEAYRYWEAGYVIYAFANE